MARGKPFEKGHKLATGRPPGSQNRLTGYMAAFAEAESPFETARKMIEGKYPCLECHGAKKLPYFENGAELTRKCKSCHGTGFECFKPEVIARVVLDMCEYEDAKRRAVEVSGAIKVGIGEQIVAAVVAARNKRDAS
jgi:hypothetical protein